MNNTLMQFLMLTGGISLVYWCATGSMLRLAPRGAYRVAMANLCIVAGLWLAVTRPPGSSFLHYQFSDWLTLGGMALFRGGINHLVSKNYRTPLTAWAPLVLMVLLTAAVPYSAASDQWRTIVWSLAAAWIGLLSFRDSYRGLQSGDFNLAARLAVSSPFFLAGGALLYRGAYAVFSHFQGADSFGLQTEIEVGFLWVMAGLLLTLNYTLGMLTAARLVSNIRNLAERDHLTGCLNRRSMEVRLKMDIEHNQHLHSTLGCILFDLDLFKRVNDTYGHAAGDAVLQHVSRVAQDAIRTVDALGRYGGEEFLVLLPGADLEGTLQTANRIRKALQDHTLAFEGVSIAVTASFGIAALGPFESAQAFVKRADMAMYQAKQLGRDRIEAAQPPAEVATQLQVGTVNA